MKELTDKEMEALDRVFGNIKEPTIAEKFNQTGTLSEEDYLILMELKNISAENAEVLSKYRESKTFLNNESI